MRVAILSAGPSLRRTWRGNFCYSVTIAVNSAIMVTKTDWLAAGDAVTMQRLAHHRPIVGCWTMACVVEAPPENWRNVRLLPFDRMPGWTGLSRAAGWSIQAAVAGAYSLGATAIDVYGHDMTGTVDVAGHDGDYRTGERWGRERLDWQATLEWAHAHGLEITTIQEK